MTDRAARGIFAAVLTPVDDTGRISVERYLAHAKWLLAKGCHGLGIFGTTSETQAFSVAERQEALEAFLAGGIPAEKVILGVGCCAVADTVALVKHALANGVTRVLALPPFFYKNNSDEGLFRAYAEVIEKVGDDRLELYLYHFPQVSQVPVTHGVIEKLLAAYPKTLKGIKDSSGDLEHTKGLMTSFPQLAVFAGADQHLLDVLEGGGAGTISAAGNLNCAANRAVFDAFEKGDMAAAREGMKLVAGVRQTVQRFPLIPGLKHVIAAGRKDPQWAVVRPPLVPLGEAQGAELLAALEAAGYVYDPGL